METPQNTSAIQLASIEYTKLENLFAIALNRLGSCLGSENILY